MRGATIGMVSGRRATAALALVAFACGSDDGPAPDTGEAGPDAGADAAPDAAPIDRRGTCFDAPPPGAVQAPDPPAYSEGTCPALVPGDALNRITSGGVEREFLVVVPEDPQPGETFPVLFLWHWLNASADSFYSRADAQSAANDQRFIAVIPNGIGQIPSNWPWLEAAAAEREAEFVFFDDMLACVSEQFPVNKNCVSSAGVSDGALWTSQLAGGRGEYLSSIVVLSGGVDSSIAIGRVAPWTPSPHKMPAIVLWGGPTDTCLVLRFEEASLNLEAALEQDGHFFIECLHDCGHAEPPFEAPEGQTKFAGLWDFVFDHPYWLAEGDSPYLDTGLPPTMPEWCGIGAGSAVPRTGGGCDGPGCTF